jgi:hypothetical protein
MGSSRSMRTSMTPIPSGEFKGLSQPAMIAFRFGIEMEAPAGCSSSDMKALLESVLREKLIPMVEAWAFSSSSDGANSVSSPGRILLECGTVGEPLLLGVSKGRAQVVHQIDCHLKHPFCLTETSSPCGKSSRH